MTYPEAIAYLQGLQMFGMNLGLDRTIALANALGRPQEKLKFIHVAGTNGKGSVCAFLESIHREAGRRTGLFTSPHLVSFTERIQVDRRPIAESDVVRWVDRLREIVEATDLTPTFFEAVTVMALGYFAEQRCDLVLWETGLGGRLDATNIVTPLASVITNIDWDHQQWLGSTLDQIAAEKAGILKSGCPAITAAEPGRGLEVIVATARERGCPLTVVSAEKFGSQGSGANDSPSFRQFTPEEVWRLAAATTREFPQLGMLGSHQILNAAVAAATVATLAAQWPVSPQALENGLRKTTWAGRLQLVRAPWGGEILLDGAHNPGSVTALRAALLEKYPGARPALILGVLGDKDWRPMVDSLASLASSVVAVPVASQRSLPAHELADACRSAAPNVFVRAAASLHEALELAASNHPPLVLITGSLYLVGEAMERLAILPTNSLSERGLNEWRGSNTVSPTTERMT